MILTATIYFVYWFSAENTSPNVPEPSLCELSTTNLPTFFFPDVTFFALSIILLYTYHVDIFKTKQNL